MHAHANMIFSLHHFYAILQVAGLGYLIGGSVIVGGELTSLINGKFNFWRHCNKSAAVFDIIKTDIVGEYK